MLNPALYDLSPLLRVMLLGACIALLPFAWAWWRNPNVGKRLQALSLLTLFLTFDLVMFGAFTRLTDSGLGCPDWPGCYGEASPLQAHPQISQAQAALPSGPVTPLKAWIEMVHRYFATAVGVLVLALLIGRWWGHAKAGLGSRRDLVWAGATFVWVCVQGAFGALTVTQKLFPAIVTLHLLGGLVLLALLVVQATMNDARPATGLSMPSPQSMRERRLIWLALAVLTLQVALGGWVSTNYAVLACTEFPLCQGSWWPLMDFGQGFTLWRPLGMTADGRFIGFEALTAIHVAHRLFAALAVAVLAVVAWRGWNLPGVRQRQARWLLGLVVAQSLTGMSNVVLGWPLVAAVLHTGGAGALVVVLTWMLRTAGTATQKEAA